MRIIFSSIFLLVNLNVFAEDSLIGFDKMVSEIENIEKDKMDTLNGKIFDLKFNQVGDYVLILQPENNFDISKTGDNTFKVTIKDSASLLYEDGPFINIHPIKWNMSVAGGVAFDFQIEGVNDCAFNFTFNQVGGDTLNLSTIPKPWEISHIVSKNNILDKVEVNGKSLLVLRRKGLNDDVSVQLIVTNSTNNIQVKSDYIEVPKCNKYAKNADEIMQKMTPGRCVKTLRHGSKESKEITEAGQRIVKMRNVRTFVNSCSLPIKCNFRNHLVVGGEDIVENYFVVDTHEEIFSIDPQSEYLMEYAFEFEVVPNKTQSSVASLLSPDGSFPGFSANGIYGDKFSCVWAR